MSATRIGGMRNTLVVGISLVSLAGWGAACGTGGGGSLRSLSSSSFNPAPASNPSTPSSSPSPTPAMHTEDGVVNALKAAGVKLCRDPDINGADESGAVDHAYWIYDAHPQPASVAGVGRYECVPDSDSRGGSTQGIDIRSYPSAINAQNAAEEFRRTGGAVVKKQNIWLWGNVAIYEIDPAASATAAEASRAVSQLPEITRPHMAGT